MLLKRIDRPITELDGVAVMDGADQLCMAKARADTIQSEMTRGIGITGQAI